MPDDDPDRSVTESLDDPPAGTTGPFDDGSETAPERRDDGWTITDDRHADASYVGTTTGGVPVFLDEETIFRGDADEDARTVAPDPETVRDLDPGETVAEALAAIGERVGWESLSELGERHVSESDG